MVFISTGKVIAAIFWNTEDVIIVLKGLTLTGDYYANIQSPRAERTCEKIKIARVQQLITRYHELLDRSHELL